jgi:hypothetical protein
MEVSLQKEKDDQAAKDAKVLKALQFKDKELMDMQSKFVRQEAEFGKLAQSFQT